MSLSQVNTYRAHWGLPPIVTPKSSPRITKTASVRPKLQTKQQSTQEPTLGRYPGTNLALLLRKCNVPVDIGCGCEEWIKAMNNWGVKGCYKNRQNIIDRLKDQAKKLSTARIIWTGILMMWNGMRPTIGELVDEAIWAASNAIALEKEQR